MYYWKYPLAAATSINFSTGHHLAAAAGNCSVPLSAIEIRPVAPSYHWLPISYSYFLRSILEISLFFFNPSVRLTRIPDTNNQAGTVLTTYCIGRMCRQGYLINCKQLQKLVLGLSLLRAHLTADLNLKPQSPQVSLRCVFNLLLKWFPII